MEGPSRPTHSTGSCVLCIVLTFCDLLMVLGTSADTPGMTSRRPGGFCLLCCCRRRGLGGDAPENHGSGVLNGFQTFAEKVGVSVPKLDVVSGTSSRFETDGLTNHKGHGFGLGLADPFGGEGTALAAMEHLVALCCRQHNTSYVAQRFMWRSPRDARKDAPSPSTKRHITFRSETAKELHNARVLAPHLSFAPAPTRVTGRQRLRFHFKIDFGVDIGGVDGNMSQPRPDRVDVYART